MDSPHRIGPDDLVDMNAGAGDGRWRVDLVYGDGRHPENIFKTSLYRAGAHLYLHRLFAPVVAGVARLLRERHGGVLILKDGLRTVEAQASMQDTAIVRAHPEWSAEGPNRMLSRPGQGGHPRGMAVDAAVADAATGGMWDMGTVFDTMTPQSARGYTGFSSAILENRNRLEQAFVDVAATLDLPLLPLPSEWWDFRFPASFADNYAPVSDEDLPDAMRMT